ncbi:uncharacterized protein N7479_000803 [Penicillium vulpinum]|uniref:MYND-type domain-containing protein n=1 Tax=Penicillium vulpinum TaxID=29845 RepID=A0A1V6S6A5_9EURO|nr:uncharacterized protein N7479_000803 [Penicillium vulpinum]KAJ5970885.1 hypothetical protein N7479_000803 [Penicillium vulpinum]OQE09398.1 hypothetical protein PENVUL_c006G08829 [Penicillium vulpinum]
MSLPSGCGVCGKKDGALRCSGCKVMMYCGVEHQKAHHREHKSACTAIRGCRVAMEKEEQVVRELQGDIFTNGIRNVWLTSETRLYMLSRASLSNEMATIRNVESLQAQLDILMEDLQLCRGDNTGSRYAIPGVMIRLHQDQECYDFLKWWATAGQNHDYDWDNNTLPYLDIKNANPLEPLDVFCDGLINLPHRVAVTLVKVKVLQVIFTEMGPRDGSTARMLGPRSDYSTIAKNPNIANCDDKWLEIVKLKGQIRTLYEAVHKMNSHFWPALVNPGEPLRANVLIFAVGSVEEMQLALRLTYEAWNEAPGAIAVIKMAIEGKL